jgi:hypothetical protein
LRLLRSFRRLLRGGRIGLLRTKQRRGAYANKQQGTQDARNSMLHCHKNLGELLVLLNLLGFHGASTSGKAANFCSGSRRNQPGQVSVSVPMMFDAVFEAAG